MSEERELKPGEKGYLKRIANECKKDVSLSIQEFKEDVARNFQEFRTETSEVISEFEQIKGEIETKISTINVQVASINSLKTSAELKKDKIEEFHDLIFDEGDDETSTSEDIEEFVNEFKASKNEIDSLKEKINEYEQTLFGYEDDEGNIVNGLEHKIDSLKNQLQTIIEDGEKEVKTSINQNSTKQEELFIRIEELLKGASTVALAKSFKEHKDSFDTMNRVWMGVFMLSIISMMAISLWGFIQTTS